MKVSAASFAAVVFALSASVVMAQHDFGVAVRGLGGGRIEVFDRRQESAGLPDQIAVQGLAGGEVVPYSGSTSQKRQESAGLPDQDAVRGLPGGIVIPYKRSSGDAPEAGHEGSANGCSQSLKREIKGGMRKSRIMPAMIQRK